MNHSRGEVWERPNILPPATGRSPCSLCGRRHSK